LLSLSKGSLNSAQAETYFEQHYSHDDYYSESHRTVGQWVGKGAADLGLAGDVSREDFAALLQGMHPHSDTGLVPAAAHNGKHAAGWDSCWSAPKSLSIQALVGGDHRLIEAHTKAVERGLAEVEAYAIAHLKGNRERVVSANIVGAAFIHLAARESLDVTRGPDPQLHTHVVLLNATRRPDGAWRGLDPLEIYRSQQYGSAVYRSELAREVQQLGYRIEVTPGKNGAWELEGYTRDQIVAFSQRRQDIEQAMAERGLSGPKAAQIIALQSRQSKTDYDQDALKAEWEKRAIEHAIDTQQIRRQAWQRQGFVPNLSIRDQEDALIYAAAHTTEREAVIDRRELEATALQHGMGRVDLNDVRGQVAQERRQHRLIQAGEPDWRHPQGAFTTADMLTVERENLARAGLKQAEPIASNAEVHQWGTAKGLLADQITAAALTLTSKDWVTALEGLAGTTKTTTVGAIRELAEAQGYTVRGFGMTSGSVKALREAAVDARTIASLLGNALSPRTSPELWIIDESSLLDSRRTNQILKAAQQQQVARVVFVGDQKQHHAIEAGAPVRQLLAAEMAVAELTTIRRQRDPELKHAVELAAQGRTKEALETLEARGRISQIADHNKRYESIATDYLRSHKAGQRTLVVSPANDERRALNEKIRALLITQGHIAQDGREHMILVQRDLTRAQHNHSRHYEVGEMLSFTRGSRRMGIGKNEYARIESIDTAANLLTIRMPDGREMNLNPAKWKGIQVYRPEERTLAPGDRIQFRAPDKALKVANGEFATVVGIDDKRATLRLDNNREIKAGLSRLRHIDYGYASTSHSAQGATVDRVIVNVDSMRNAQLVNQKQFYVSISRARSDARIYTDDMEALGRAVGRRPEKSIALDAVKEQQAQEQTQKLPLPMMRT
jgi:conjugative relaxase-like TrwC/TraI family protein